MNQQDVIRHWYARETSILNAVKGLQSNTHVCKKAILDSDVEKV